MNEIKRLKAWYKKKIEDWENTVCTLGFTSLILNLLLMTFFLVTKGKIGLLFLLAVIVQGFGITFLTHEYEIESEEENLKIFLKKVGECLEKMTTPEDKIEIASHNYQTVPYDMLIKALGDYGFCAANSTWRPFTENDYDRSSTLYLVRCSRSQQCSAKRRD